MMDVRQIERLMAAMESHGVTELNWSEGEQSLCLSRESRQILVSAPEAALQAALPAMPMAGAAPAADAKGDAPAEGSPGHKEIVSPMVGTFHPAQGKPLKAGAKFKKGEVVCVIEAMKLMNDIVMEEDGEIVFFALKDGDMVEYGQVIAQYK